MKTKIAIACDDLGFETKEAIKKYLIEEKNADVVYDPVQVPEDGVNTFAKLADEMSVLIQKDVCRLAINIGEFEQQLLQILILQKEQD